MKVKPDGITRPTTGLDTPTLSSLVINCGTTDSEELVPSTVNSSSFMYLRNFQRLKPDKREMKPRMITTNRKQVMYMVAISLPSETMEPRPYLPTVKAIAPHAANGATRMIMPTMWNMPWEKASSTSTTGLPRGPRWDSAMPKRVEKSRIGRIWFFAKASVMLAGITLIRKSVNPPELLAAEV
ncbi:hypothetical protein D3C71_1318610 [compost metagenome]